MKAWVDFDAWLITNIFEPLAWHFEATLKINCFALSRYAFIFGLAMRTMAYLRHEPPAYQTVDLISGTGLVICITLLSMVKEYGSNRQSEYLNTWKQYSGIRFVYMFFPFTDLYVRWKNQNMLDKPVAVIGAILMLAGLYFLSCNRMPPGWKSRKQKIEGKLLSESA
jgi:hypothetical protein